MVQRRLGRGLDFLLGDSRGRAATEAGVPIDSIRVNPCQPRRSVTGPSLEELKSSIRTHGLLQPLVVRREGEGYVLIAGERRWRACKDLGMATVPVVLRDEGADSDLELALIENLQREDLSAIEEAQAYRELKDRYGFTHDLIAERIGKSRPFITNRLRLLELEPEIQEAVSRGTISAGHARALLSIRSPEERLKAFRELLENKVSVREAESRVRHQGGGTAKKGVRQVPPEVREIEERLSERLGARVLIKDRNNRGRILIDYRGLEDFERICALLQSAKA
ncbi:MAG: ParB/RepB/Spo0J family partition protein [Planctomycetota bacterium]